MSKTVSENAKFNVANNYHQLEKSSPTVMDFMVDHMPCLSPDMDVYEAAKMLLELDTNGLPVLDDNNQLVGFLSEKDCLKHSFDCKYNALPPRSVKDFMSTLVQCLDARTDISKAIDLFINQNFHCYPIVKNGEYVGLLYRNNALKAVTNMKDDLF